LLACSPASSAVDHGFETWLDQPKGNC
jgi:hypothetical protein